MTPNNNLAKNLKAYQHSLGMSQKEFAARLNVPRSTIQTVMAKNGNTTVDTLIRISVSLPFSLDDLVFGDLSCEPKEEVLCLSGSSLAITDSTSREHGRFYGLLGKLLRPER